jgi:hypothetical protein
MASLPFAAWRDSWFLHYCDDGLRNGSAVRHHQICLPWTAIDAFILKCASSDMLHRPEGRNDVSKIHLSDY